MLKPVVLAGEQKKVLFLPPKNPIQIKGVAGSGKTTVALYRAKHLLENHSDMFEPTRVAIFTFNKTLSGYITALTAASEQDPNFGVTSAITVTNFHRWAWHFLKDHGNELVGRTISGTSQYGLLARAINSLPASTRQESIMSKSHEFFREEISWIKGKLFSTIGEYLEAKRVGRGTSDRVTQKDKETIWAVYTAYQQVLQNMRHIDFDDYAPLVLREIENSTFKPPFTHIVVDEAQDLNKAQVSVLSRLVETSTNSISLIADAAQRIYKSGFTWGEVGINVRGGRTIEFKKNYRNTLGIASAASSLLSHDSDSSDFTEIEPHSTDSSKPLLKGFNTEDDELVWVSATILVLSRSIAQESICVAHRTTNGIKKLAKLLHDLGVSTEFINGNDSVNYNDDTVKLSTMSSIKGLEFDHVFIIGLSDAEIPLPAGFSEPDDELHISTERRLLYTCMTRAKASLTLSYHGIQSRYLKEVSPTLLNFERP
jgi:superfamily I DNA/RNA helicase